MSNKEENSKAEALKNLDDTATVEFDDKATSLGKVVDREQQAKVRQINEVQQKYGWHSINVETFPSGGNFYPTDIQIKIKSADTPQVRHFSSINEQDPFSVNEALNDLLITCCQVKIGDRLTSYKDICEEDRIHVILEIRELTFPKGENKLSFQVTCESCDQSNEIEIKNSNFQHTESPEDIKKYYSYEDRCFSIKTKTYGEIIIKPPSIGIMQIVAKYIQKKRQESKKKLDTEFIKCLSYMITDWRNIKDKDIDNLHVEYQRWDSKRFSLMIKLIEWAKISVSEDMKVTCSNQNCGVEVTAPITFPGGVKNLFVISDFSDELL